MARRYKGRMALHRLLPWLLLAGCAAGPPPLSPDDAAVAPAADLAFAPACTPEVPRTSANRLAVFPDEGEQPFVDILMRAQKSVRVMVYLMGRGGVLDGLKARAKAGLPVRVILDQSQKDTNQKYFDELAAAGVDVTWSDPRFTYMHAKVILVDEREALVTTGNYSVFQIEKERNFGVVVTDPADIAVLVALFDADWARKEPDLSCTRLLVSPVNARERLLAHIAGAKKTLLVHSMQFADRDVREAVAARKRAGVEVRALLADPGWIEANREGADFLAGIGAQARWRASVHVKAITVDGERAFVGSENLSWTSLTKNREVGVIVTERDAVRAISDVFEKDWAGAKSF
jgi:phosphatidylserine/phosphatidylglycerophosphate/cardiolipin synthase-like enzyme